VFVGNISFTGSDEELKEWFTKHECDVEEVQLITDRGTQRLHGYGFVQLADAASYKKALNLTGKLFKGRVLTINEARPEVGS